MPILTSRTLAASALLLVGAFGLAGCTAPAAGTNTVSTPSAAAPAVTTPSAEPTSDAPFDYTNAGFVPSLKTTQKQCFGTYGCNVTVEVDLAVLDSGMIPADASGSITYEISGVKDGPIIGTIELSGTNYTPPTQFFQTATKSSTPKVKITDTTTN